MITRHIYHRHNDAHMETVSASHMPRTPQAMISPLRRPVQAPQQATRSMQAADESQSQSQPQTQHLSQPASQESFVSLQSQGSSVAPHLQSTSSNLSQLTQYTDPISPAGAPNKQPEYTSQPRDVQRVRTPEYARHDARADGIDQSLASPMSVTSPMSVNGAKRTSSGHVKNAPSLGSIPTTPMTAIHDRRRSRAESISSTSSRAGELAQTLKARLGYAMAKVQHGWEHKNLAEVEQLAAHKASPNRHSVTYGDYRTGRPMSAGLSNGTKRMSMYDSLSNGSLDGPTSPPSKRRSGNYTYMMTSPRPPQYNHGAAPSLQPPVDIRPGTSSSRTQTHHRAPSNQQHKYTSNPAMSPPRTPINGEVRRPLNVRTDTQTAQAERDALDALFQLGSPHGTHQSQFSRQVSNLSQNSSQGGSPLRAEYATPRRVTFARGGSEGGRSSRSQSIEESAEV